MKKTVTKDDFEKLSHEVISEAMEEANNKNMSGGAFMAYSMTYVIAFHELAKKLFDEDTDAIEIIKENV